MIVMIVIAGVLLAAAVIFSGSFAAGKVEDSPKAVPRGSGQRPVWSSSPEYVTRRQNIQSEVEDTESQRRQNNPAEFDAYAEAFLWNPITFLSPHNWTVLTEEERQQQKDAFYQRVDELKSDVMRSKTLQKHMKDRYFHDTKRKLTDEELARDFIPLISRHAIVSKQMNQEKRTPRSYTDVTRISRDKQDVISSLSTRPGAKLELAKTARRNDNWLGLLPYPDIPAKIGIEYM